MKLKKWLEDNGETQTAFAKRLGVNQAAISRLCGDALPHWPTRAFMRKIVTATHGEVTADDFLWPSKPKRKS